MDLVIVYRTFNSADAQLIRSRLEAAGIEAAVINENSSLDLGVGGNIFVQVAETDLTSAREVIQSADIGGSSAPNN
jgi:hypothetical protein